LHERSGRTHGQFISAGVATLLTFRLHRHGNRARIRRAARHHPMPHHACAGGAIVTTLLTAEETIDPKLVGIGGWLILPAIGFVLGPILGVVGLVMALGLYDDVARAGFSGIYTLELLVQLVILGVMLYAATLFFGKKRNAPSVIIMLLAGSLIASVVLLVVEIGAGAEAFAAATGTQLVREAVAAAIWISYFRQSKRVKATFVN
jgi:hypothetical protein